MFMRTLRRPTVLLALTAVLSPAGCSSTAGLRTGNAPKIRTVASVGDKPLPAEAGQGDATVAADEYTPERQVDPNGRVSGRVFDDKGNAVPNARVRLALGGASAGKIVTATTDRSGAFTLHGLRPGVSYTIVAESKDRELGPLRGQCEAQAPETGVKITLAADEDSGPPARASSSVGRKVSRPRVEESDDEDQEQSLLAPAPAPGRNELLPPAPEAESFLPSKARGLAKPDAGTDAEAPMTARWRRGDSDQPASRSRSSARTSGPAVPADDEPYDDDGHNPLPPALAPGASGAPERTSANVPDRGSAPARNLKEPDSKANGADDLTLVALADARVADAASPAPSASESPPSPRAASAVPAPPAVPWYEAATPASEPPAPSVAHEAPALVTDDEDSSEPPRRRATWRELAASATSAPSETSHPVEPAAESRTVLATSDSRPAPAPTAAAPAQDNLVAYCRFDAKSRRIVDFRLPDISGKPTRLQDLDSDLVLLDFWGTWCKPCVNSIPHLVELQNRLGGKRLTVVGIASEQGTPAARAATVAQAVQRLGINYPVLLSGMDGESCPVQEALHIQAFPTLILLDRQGRVLWRDQGATPATLARLDHFIASTVDTGDTRRY